VLGWLRERPGDSWQQRWRASSAGEQPDWRLLVGSDRAKPLPQLISGLLVLISADVIRPGLDWLLRFAPARHNLAAEMARTRLIVGRFTSPMTESEVRISLYDESVEICTRAQHPLAHRCTINFADLGDYPWIIPGTEMALRREIEQLFARPAMPLPDNRVEAPSWLIVRQLLVESDYLAALPGPMELCEPGLRALPVSFEPMRHNVGITTVAGRVLSPWANALIQRLQAIAMQRLHDVSADNIRGRGAQPAAAALAASVAR
jgi:DNA-binding transcriptional LysR family regulator